MWRLEARPAPSRRARWLAPLAALALTIVLGALLFAALGQPPGRALAVFFLRPLQNGYGVGEWLLKATPLMLCGLGLALGFRANVWNIGAEGQLILGAVAAGGLAIAFEGSDSALLLPAMMVAGILGGMAWAAIPALLRTSCQTNEILTSLMLAYVAPLLLAWLVNGPWRDPDGFNFPQSIQFGEAALLTPLFDGTRLTAIFPLALGLALAAWLFQHHSYLGFQMNVAGHSAAAARYAGFSADRTVWMALLIGGGCAGLAGFAEVAGPLGQLLPNVSPGYGFAAIVVAFVGRLHPVGVVLASLLMSLLYLGGEAAQMELDLPAAITGLFQGALLFALLACDTFVNYRLRWRRQS
ncbi:MAG: ral nucleoside transport system permease protein [Pseudomonadota bacterium]|nr:ral nucleoside transport system permease protein [Pseudomonadota bacterium]